MRDIVSEIKRIRVDLNEIGSKVNGLEEKPAKRGEMLAGALIGAIGGGCGTMLLNLLLGG